MRESKLIPDALSAPLFVLWDLTYRCTCDCIHCYNSSGRTWHGPELTLEQAINVADQLIEMGVLSVCLCGGEALLHPAFEEVATRLVSSGVGIGTSSNGWLIDRETARKLARLMNGIQISIDGLYDVHDWLRGRQGSFRRAIEAIHYLMDEGVQVNIAFVATKANLNQYPDVVRLAVSLGVTSVGVGPLIASGNAYDRRELWLSPADIRTLESMIANMRAKYPTLRTGYVDYFRYFRRCVAEHLPNSTLNIQPNGEVKGCPHLPIVIGNLHRNSLREIWQNGGSRFWTRSDVRECLGEVSRVLDSGRLKSIVGRTPTQCAECGTEGAWLGKLSPTAE